MREGLLFIPHSSQSSFPQSHIYKCRCVYMDVGVGVASLMPGEPPFPSLYPGDKEISGPSVLLFLDMDKEGDGRTSVDMPV